MLVITPPYSQNVPASETTSKRLGSAIGSRQSTRRNPWLDRSIVWIVSLTSRPVLNPSRSRNGSQLSSGTVSMALPGRLIEVCSDRVADTFIVQEVNYV